MVITIIIQKERWIITRKKRKREKEKLARKRDGLLQIIIEFKRLLHGEREMDGLQKDYRLLDIIRKRNGFKQRKRDYSLWKNKREMDYRIITKRERNYQKEREKQMDGLECQRNRLLQIIKRWLWNLCIERDGCILIELPLERLLKEMTRQRDELVLGRKIYTCRIIIETIKELLQGISYRQRER